MPIRRYHETDFLPRGLNADEIENPNLVIHELFDAYSLPSIRELLWKWLRVTFSPSRKEELRRGHGTDILDLYELINKVVEAIHVGYQKRKAVTTRSGKRTKKQR